MASQLNLSLSVQLRQQKQLRSKRARRHMILQNICSTKPTAGSAGTKRLKQIVKKSIRHSVPSSVTNRRRRACLAFRHSSSKSCGSHWSNEMHHPIFDSALHKDPADFREIA